MVDYNGNIDARLTEVSQKGATDRAEKGIPLLVASEEPISSDDLAATYVDMDLEITWMGRLLNATRVRLSFCLERSHYAILLRLGKMRSAGHRRYRPRTFARQLHGDTSNIGYGGGWFVETRARQRRSASSNYPHQTEGC